MRDEGWFSRIDLIRLSVKLEVQTTSVRKDGLALTQPGHVHPSLFTYRVDNSVDICVVITRCIGD
jgi:hypothetical protein